MGNWGLVHAVALVRPKVALLILMLPLLHESASVSNSQKYDVVTAVMKHAQGTCQLSLIPHTFDGFNSQVKDDEQSWTRHAEFMLGPFLIN